MARGPVTGDTREASVPILIFHSLDERGSVISFSPRAFRHSMATLHDSGYRTLSLLQVVHHLHNHEPFPPRSFVLTFDDGYRTVYDVAFPALQQYGMSATVFLTVGEGKHMASDDRLPPQQGRDMLNWRQIREMHRRGMDIGAHTCTHPDLTRLPVERIEAETCSSKAIIEDALGAPVCSFAYPYGRYDARSREIAARHFACACSDILSLVTQRSDPYALERVDAYYLRPGRLFDLILTDWFPWYVRARRITRGIKRFFMSRMW
jgi:peptidoglycan/xylan/chitin deacetylase (PgdA/CDA1 family)